MRPPPLAAAALVALAAAACDRGTAADATAWQTVTDTIGDTVVVRTVGASDSAAALRLVADLRIGELEGDDEYTFGAVGAVLPAPGGGAYVWDDMATVLRRYDAAGTFVRNVGGKGGGPGEYEATNGMALLADGRLAFWDPRNSRVVVYDTAGAAVGGWRVTGGFFTQRAVSTDAAGTVALFTLLDTVGSGTPLTERRQGYVRYRPDGTVVDSVLAPLRPERATQLTAVRRDGNRTMSSSSTNVPFAPQVACARGPHGWFACGRGDRYAITLFRPGAPLRIERDVPPVPVQPDERASEEESITAMMRGTDPSWRWSGPAIPAEKPYFRSLEVDADGRIWVRRSQPGERVPDAELAEQAAARGGGPPRFPPRRWREPMAYDVFAPDGRLLGHLPVPRGTSLHHMRGDTVWGVQRDSLDVPYVVRFRVEPSLAGGGTGAARP